MDYLADDPETSNPQQTSVKSFGQLDKPTHSAPTPHPDHAEISGLLFINFAPSKQTNKGYERMLSVEVIRDVCIFVHTKFQNVAMKEKNYPTVAFVSNDIIYSGVFVKIVFCGCCPCLILNMQNRRNVVYHLSGKMYIFREWYSLDGTSHNKITDLSKDSLLKDLFDGLNWVCDVPRKYW
jgi:hypothetical protein